MSTVEQIYNGRYFERDMVKENAVIVNKRLLTDDQIEYFTNYFNESSKKGETYMMYEFATREALDFEIDTEFLNDWKMKLDAYIPITKIASNAKFRRYKGCGKLKEHIDGFDYDEDLKMKSKYTLLIYLTDCNSGETAIKRPKYRLIDDNVQKPNERIYVTPKAGNCILFNSSLMHYANPIYEDKLILTLKIFSD